MEFELHLSVPFLSILFSAFYFSLFSMQLPPLPHFSLTLFCAEAHILWTGLYIVFEIIFGCLCLRVPLNEYVGHLPAYLCVWMSDDCNCLCVGVYECVLCACVKMEEWERGSSCWRLCTFEGMFFIFTCLCICMCVYSVGLYSNRGA